MAGASTGKKESKSEGGRVRLSNVDTRDLAGFEDELICSFILAADMVGGRIREFCE